MQEEGTSTYFRGYLRKTTSKINRKKFEDHFQDIPSSSKSSGHFFGNLPLVLTFTWTFTRRLVKTSKATGRFCQILWHSQKTTKFYNSTSDTRYNMYRRIWQHTTFFCILLHHLRYFFDRMYILTFCVSRILDFLRQIHKKAIVLLHEY